MKKIADLVSTKKGFFLRYSSKGISHLFATKKEAIEFTKIHKIIVKNL